ncbi:MAG TPA: Isoquinoline 1-oxidoreductase subunit [Polyangiaceae bacterium]|nr:Isoquinoline 1-oxidoreductase subunit [Polyangiaceae bacterium]
MRSLGGLLLVIGLAPYGCSRGSGDARGPESTARELAPVEADELRPLASFAAFPEGAERARALFGEASRVLLHPRCANCHVEGDSPAQGMSFALHEPPVVRGAEDRGVVGMECAGCHQDRNLELSRVPGAPDWRLPPRAMAWVGRTPNALCEQLSDRARNGGRTLAEVVDHVGHDAFVTWGWAPGADRVSAPGSQQEFAAILGAWADNGGACPPENGGGQ